MATDLNTTGVKIGTKYLTAKMWAFFNTISTHAIKGSYGFSGITDRGAGYCSLEFSTNQPNINWALSLGAGDNHRMSIDGNTVLVDAAHLMAHSGGTNTSSDCTRSFCTIHGE